MGIIGKDFKYKKIVNFLTKEEISLLKNYCLIKHQTNLDSFDTLQSDTGDTYFYGDPTMESLMLSKQKQIEEESGKKLLPTYSFWRMYTNLAELKKHIDRKSCEISVTVYIASDGTSWPIYMEGTSIELNPGDAIIYLGCELEHWRDMFQGDWHAQCFLHYVDADGVNKSFAKDQRLFYGIQK